jgi:putative membrane fusion protein
VPRYESGKVYGAGRRARSGGRRAPDDRTAPAESRKARTGRPLPKRSSARSLTSSGRGRRRRASARPPRRWLKVALIILVGTGLLLAGGYSTLKSLVLPQLAGIVVAREGRIEETVSARAFIIRHESILRSPVSGTVTLTLPEGARTRKDGEVASLSDTQEKAEAEDRVAQLEADLISFNASNAQEEAALSATLAASGTELTVAAEALRLACLGSDFTSIGVRSSELAFVGQRRKEARARLETIRKDRAAIDTALATARAALQQSVFPILASEAGLVSYCLDGVEETLTPESIGQYGTKEILSLTARAVSTPDKSRVQAGSPVAKIVSDVEVYVSVVVTNGQADDISAVTDVTLRFPGFEDLSQTKADLFHVGQRERNGYCLVTYRAKELLPGMVSSRQTQTTIVVRSWTGAIVPRKAIVHRGGQDGVFVLDVNVCRFRPVEVLGGDARDVVVDGLPANTSVISRPWLVREGTRIGDTWRSRFGIAGPPADALSRAGGGHD